MQHVKEMEAATARRAGRPRPCDGCGRWTTSLRLPPARLGPSMSGARKTTADADIDSNSDIDMNIGLDTMDSKKVGT